MNESEVEVLTSEGIYKVLTCSNEIQGIKYKYKFTIPANIAIGYKHIAKAVEESIEAKCRGEALRKFELEFYRRLLIRRQVKDVIKIVNEAKNLCKNTCIVYVIDVHNYSKDYRAACRKCPLDLNTSLKLIFGEDKTPPEYFRKSIELLEMFTTSLVALTRIGRWL